MSISEMNPPSTPVLQRTVTAAEAKDLPQLVDKLKLLVQQHTNIIFSVNSYDDDGKYLISGPTEEQLYSATEKLEKLVGASLEFSELYVIYRETVTKTGEVPALSKSPNKHNRLWVTATPLDEDLSKAIDNKDVDPAQDIKPNAALLAEQYGWNEREARKIWTYGPDKCGPNVIVDTTKAVVYLHEIKDSFISGFQWATHEGPLCESPMRSVRFNIVDVGMFSDAIHRGAGQIIPTARRVCYAALLMAKPTLMEPIYRLEVRIPKGYVASTREWLEAREGKLIEETQGSDVIEFKAHIPVRCSLGFSAALDAATDGTAKAEVRFDHWECVTHLGDALDPNSKLYAEIIKPMRLRKGRRS